ncbi:hypothetical protein OHC33_004912 [Knufia fluminis]|uniref:FMN hydroxy acid dehydrogenase domain-containing protein n=1 Tax=Knufia fluminis TaxID=191047 RepID=A0AAN8EFC3_9EURO|nr:hypothetical protein OHC33_004912 [Knufia fluminis]
MYKFTTLTALCSVALAARPFLNEPDTGIELILGTDNLTTLPPLSNVVGLPDFDFIARQHLAPENYTYYRNGAAGEWSYRNNLEVFQRVTSRPRVLVNVSQVSTTLGTTILGQNFSAPFFICPCARGEVGNVNGELGLVQGAADGDILYIPSGYSSTPLGELAAARVANGSYEQTMWQQTYLTSNDTETQIYFDEIAAGGFSAIVFTIDSAAAGVRHRADRFGAGSVNTAFDGFTWEYYEKLKTMTKLPIVLKGIQTVEDALLAVEHGAPAIVLSNHGGRNLDTSPSSLEIAYEIHEQAPQVFNQTEVLADGGVRYGSDVLKLMALGVKAVGLGRPFMYANIYGTEGVRHAIERLKFEVMNDAAHLGLQDIHDVSMKHFKWAPNFWYS